MTKERFVIALQPIGSVDVVFLKSLRRPLASLFKEQIAIVRPLPVPSESFLPGRRQYDADTILHGITTAGPANRTLGVIDVDLFVRGLNFVFGLADEIGMRALISLWRLRQETYGLPRNDELFRRRALTEAVHELGHTYGLGHCSSVSCVMHFSNSLSETDSKGWDFCAACRRKTG